MLTQKVLHPRSYYHFKVNNKNTRFSILEMFKVTKFSKQQLQSTLSLLDSLFFGDV